MTDRFYPKGTQTYDEDSLKSTYTLANEMRSFHRSAYPPGYQGHEPGVREKFGYSAPGPHAWRLADPYHALTEDVNNTAPRQLHAAVKSKAHDPETFHELDLPAYSHKLQLQASQVIPEEFRTVGSKAVGRSLSSTRKDMKPLADKKDAIINLEDDKFTYFVPAIYSKKGREKLLKTYDLLKLEKKNKILPAVPGEGTGFRCQGGGTNWWPNQDNGPAISQTQATYRRLPLLRSVSASALHGF